MSSDGKRPFDEQHLPTGELRSHYQAWARFAEIVGEKRFTDFSDGIFKFTKGVYRLNSIPLLIPARESETVRAGIVQRARAFQAFLRDVHSGADQYLKFGFAPRHVVQRLKKRWPVPSEVVNVENFSFIYGPDLIRAEDGSWVVLEDNVTLVGGIPTEVWNRRLYFKTFPEFQTVAKPPTKTFLATLVQRMREASPVAKGKVVVLSYQVPGPFKRMAMAKAYCHEQKLLKEEVQKLGAEHVFVNPLAKSGSFDRTDGVRRKLHVDASGDVWLKTTSFFGRTLKREPVGFVWVDISLYHLYRWAVPGL